MKVDPELVARMAAGDRAAFLVFADLLQTQDHPFGELVALEQAGATKQAEAVFRKHRKAIVGDLRIGGDGTVFADGFLRRVTVRNAEHLDAVLALPASLLLEELRLPLNPDGAMLARVSTGFRHLHKLFTWLGAFAALDSPRLVRLAIWVDAPLRRQLDPVLAARRLGGLRELELIGDGRKSAELSDAWMARFFRSPLLRQLNKLAITQGHLLDTRQGELLATEAEGALGHLEAISLGNSSGDVAGEAFGERFVDWQYEKK